MNLKDKIAICSNCEKRSLNRDIGLVCPLTGEKPTFEISCYDFAVDKSAVYHSEKKRIEHEVEDVSPWRIFVLAISLLIILVRIIMRFSDY